MTREDVRAALSIQPPGAFIIRFSESHPGRFGVAYISTDTPPHLKHYLVKPTDTAAAKITLPDFLRDKPQFSHILQLRPDPSGRPHFELREKHVAFGFFYSNRDEGINEEGYDPL
uniref:SH2 domain-containing protein n=2 Tax=Paramoeba aestuarina TaxID=180227 RepID=A0A7S4K7P0_9EUKA|mmetsp:Transcript_1596/g.2463  ORF Transcript_1596/g.2463 Transcript_1596/m.2463 type:complete len:115 (+) Transcript_1596:119-463(+)